jgi:quinol monooxygenase YgiN
MIIEIVRIAVEPRAYEQLKRALAAWSGPTTAEAGCISCRILQEKSESRALYYQAQWKTKEDLLRHLSADHYKRLLSLMELGNGPPLVEFHTVSETKGFDLIERTRNVI